MKKRILILLAFLGVIFLFFYFFAKDKNEVSIPNENSEAQEEKTQNIIQEESNPISIPAFSEKEFNGHGFKVGQVLDDNSAYTRYYITYESGELTISGIMNVPKGDGPFPVLFLNHGYIDPDIYTNGRGLKREQDYLTRNGYVVVHSDYRNHNGSDKEADPEAPDFSFGYVEDVINGILAIQKADLPYIDAKKIGMLGHSRGGGVAEMIAVIKPDLVDAVVLFAPVSADQADNFEKWTRPDSERAQKTIERFGTPGSNPKTWQEASPINYFDKITAPVIFHHGTADESCALEWSQRAAKALEEAGKDVTLYIYPGELHEFVDAWPMVMKRTLEFFNNNLKNK